MRVKHRSGPEWIALQEDAATRLYKAEPGRIKLVLGSPPYPLKQKRYKDHAAVEDSLGEWLRMMVNVTKAAIAACAGDVIWIVNNPVVNGRYVPAVESLMSRLYQWLDRPVIWHKNATPNRKDWFTNNWEYCLCFRAKPSPRQTWNWEAVAQPPKYTKGGRFRQRMPNGERRLGNEYPVSKLARPGDVIRITVGGGHMGYNRVDDKLACENEAPFPVKLAEHFIKTLTNKGDLVFDPFCGSGSTLAAAKMLDRRAGGCDTRMSQILLVKKRMDLLLKWKAERDPSQAE